MSTDEIIYPSLDEKEKAWLSSHLEMIVSLKQMAEAAKQASTEIEKAIKKFNEATK